MLIHPALQKLHQKQIIYIYFLTKTACLHLSISIHANSILLIFVTQAPAIP